MSVADEGYEDLDFEALEQAVRQSPKGNWFLDEYARRLRSTETSGILNAIAKLERIITSQGPALEAPRQEPGLPARQLRYFKNDEALFEEAKPAPTVSAIDASPAPEAKPQAQPEQRGARLKIMRMEQPAIIGGSEAAAAQEAPPAAGQTPEEARKSAMDAAEATVERHKQRIIISRHASAEALSIPLLEDQPSSASG